MVDSVQATKGNLYWLAIVDQVIDLPAVSAPGMIWADSTMVVDVHSLQVGEPADADEHAIWLFGDGTVARARRLVRDVRRIKKGQRPETVQSLGEVMTSFRILCVAAISIIFSSLVPAQEETTAIQVLQPVMTVDFVGKPFPGGLNFSADGSKIWTDRLEAWSVRDGQRADSSPFKRFKKSRLIIDLVANQKSMLIAIPESGELLFWDQSTGLRRRELKRTGKLVTARYIDKGKRFALVFSEPPTIYYGNTDSDEHDSTVPLSIDVSKCTISPDGNLLAVRNDRDVMIWDVKKGGIRTNLQHEYRPFSFTFSHDGRRLATGTSNDNMVRLFDTSRGALVCELKAHTEGSIFLRTAVYALAFAPNGKWLASGGHDGRVVVWDLANRKPLGQTQIEGPPIVCSLTFSPDSNLLAGSFENVGAKRGIRVWRVLGDADSK